MSRPGVTKSEALRRRIIWHLRFDWSTGDGSTWKSFSDLADELETSVRAVKREVRRMARLGRLYHSQLYHEKLGFCGSGYLLDPRWERHVPGRGEDPEDGDYPEALEEIQNRPEWWL